MEKRKKEKQPFVGKIFAILKDVEHVRTATYLTFMSIIRRRRRICLSSSFEKGNGNEVDVGQVKMI